MTDVSADLKYTKDHEWVRSTATRPASASPTTRRSSSATSSTSSCPEVGRTLKKGDVFGTIESVKAVSELFAPVSRRGRRGQRALADKPEAVNTDPHARG